jgi:hypothetical protein
VAVLLTGVVAIGAGRSEQARPQTLEDIYGDTGNSFQAAIGFIVFEGTTSSPAKQSYGLSVDDMVVKWREFTLDPDVTDCADGSCATIELGTTGVFAGRSVLRVSVLESTPDVENDCDLDGSFDGTDDCNDNGIADVVVQAASAADIAGEILFLDQTPAAVAYTGMLPVSSQGDSPGVLFVAAIGSDPAVVTVTYLDRDDGTGSPCPNSVDPAEHGIVRSTTGVLYGATCEIRVVSASVRDNGDGDIYPDTNETVAMQLELLNNCGTDLHHCSARLLTNSPYVDCILDPVIDLGTLPDTEETILTDEEFVWKVSDVERTTIDEDLRAEFGVTIVCDEIDGLSAPQSFSLNLDLDWADFGQTPTAWTEGFEEGTLGKFVPENLDAGIPGLDNTQGLINGDGWRCQYSDPDWHNSAAYANASDLDCYPGATLEQANAIFWQTDGIDTGSPDGGRAKSGDYSMYYGIYLTDPPGEFTTPLAVVESVRTIEPINLGTDSPELSFWHQVSLVDGRFLSIDPSRNAGRGVVQVKTVDLAGDDTSDWTRIEPFKNSYDTQNYDFYFNCMFDPVDDGTTEDDFFDPTDPNRRLGPSSTCHPEFTYSCLGDTDEPFATANICNANTPPGPDDAGDLGTGTWVESRVDLTERRGRRILLRFLVTDVKASSETHEGQFDGVNPGEWDNGWWIDDVTVDETFTVPADFVVDSKVVRHCAGNEAIGCLAGQDCVDSGTTGPCEGEAPDCGPTCQPIAASVRTVPDQTGGAHDERLAVPGMALKMDAATSSGVCLDGVLLFRFSVDGGPELRSWSDDPVHLLAPVEDTDYRVDVRCSVDTSCDASTIVAVEVECPSSGHLTGVFAESIVAAPSKTEFVWTTPLEYHLFSGDLEGVSSYAGTLTSGLGSSFQTPLTPLPGQARYYLVRTTGEFCNNAGLWTTGGNGESPLRATSLP